MNVKSVVVLALMFAVIMPTALSAVCPSGYNYYVNKTLTERSGVALPNHAVEFALDTATLISGGKMNASACGVYIKGVDGTALPSWIVDGTCNKAATRIFTKIPRLTAGGNYKINVCYGDLTPTISSTALMRIFTIGDNFNTGTAVNTSYWTKSSADGSGFTTQIVNNSYMNFTMSYTNTPRGVVYYPLPSNTIKNYYAEMKFRPMSSLSAATRARGATAYGGGNMFDYASGAFYADSSTNTMTQAFRFQYVNTSGTGIGSVWQKAVFKGNYSTVDGNATTYLYNDNTGALVSFMRTGATGYGFDTQSSGGLAMGRFGSSNQRNPAALWDYAFLRNATMSPNKEPNVSYSSGELPSSDPCALNPTGNTALATSAVCSGDLGSTTGNITINDGVAIEFRNAIISLTGANASISVEGSVIFNRTTIKRTPTSSRDGWTMETKNADAPIRIYKSYFDQLRRARMDKDNSYIDGIYLNSTTGVGMGNAYGMIFGKYSNITLLNATTVYQSVYSFYFNQTKRTTINGLFGGWCPATGAGYPLYLAGANRTDIRNVETNRCNSGVTLANNYKPNYAVIQNVRMNQIAGNSAPFTFNDGTGSRFDNILIENIVVSRNTSTASPGADQMTIGAGQATNCTIKDVKFIDFVGNLGGIRSFPSYFYQNKTKQGSCTYLNVTDFNSTSDRYNNYRYVTLDTSTLATRMNFYYYFQPNISVNGVSLSGGNISLHSRFGDTSFLTQANGVPLGTQANFVFSANVSGATVLRHLYNVSVYNSSGGLIYTKENLMINNSNWNRDIDISGEMSVVMNSLGGTNTTSLLANFSYTPTSTRTESEIAECNLTLNGSIVGTDVSILNDTAQIFLHNFTELDNNKCFSVAVTCRTDAEPYSIGQSVPINYCLAIPAAAGYVQQFGIEGIIGGAIDATAGLLAGFASMSENLGTIVAISIIILLISGVIGMLLLAVWKRLDKG